MKKILFILFVSATTVHAQTKKPVKKPVSLKPAPVIKLSSIDSLSYAMGVQTASYFKIDGVDKINPEMVKKAYDDVYNNKPLLIGDEQCSMFIQNKLQQLMADKVKTVKEAGNKFLEENKKKPGVITLPSGLQYEVITKGTGAIPKATDTIKAHYIGSTIDGKEFQSSYKMGQPIVISVSGVIRGWTEALQMMPVGSKWRLYIPSDLGYGDRGAGSAIPGGAALIFDIELLDIVNKK